MSTPRFEHVFDEEDVHGNCEYCRQSYYDTGGHVNTDECPALLRDEVDWLTRQGRTLFMPTIGTQLVLAQDWAFTLHEEHRNHKFAHALGLTHFKEYPLGRWVGEIGSPDREYVYDTKPEQITLPKGTRLKVDRIYIRKGKDMEDFDSVTFYVNSHVKGRSKAALATLRGRFWAKRDDVNRIRFTLVEET